MLFSRKHEHPPILIRIGSHVLPQATTFKYLGVFFDCGLRWSTQTKYVKRRCLQRINLLKSVADVSWGAHPCCMLLLYIGLIGSVLEYDSVCYAEMAGTHMLLLERITHSVSSSEDMNGHNGIYTQQQSRGSEWESTATTQIVLS
jgi:hypothetical protein